MSSGIYESTESGMYTIEQRDFLGDLENKEYRQAFVDELVGTSLAFQIRRLRDAQQLTQEALAKRTGKAQETISQWENPDYGRYSLATLKSLAAAFDVGLLVRFVSFSELADWTVNVSSDRLTPASYAEELQFAFVADHCSFAWPSSDDKPLNWWDKWVGILDSDAVDLQMESNVDAGGTVVAGTGEEAYAYAAD